MAKPTKRYENLLSQKGFQLIAGVDEVGRGPLAGPVAAAAIILPSSFHHPQVNDSKRMTALMREKLYSILTKEALAIGIGIVDAETIDNINILQATHLAAELALKELSPKPDFALLDGRDRLSIAIPHKAIIAGDCLCFSIAAASIIAKVTRDRLMLEFHNQYPGYGFDRHKGYGTREHYKKIAKHGPCPIHRQSFVLTHDTPQSKIALDIQSVSS